MNRHFLLTCAVCMAFATQPISAGNSQLAIRPDGKRLLVANTDNGTVSVVDTMANKTLREIQVGREPQSVAWLAAGPLAVVANYLDDTLVVFDTESGAITQTIATGPEPYGVVTTRDGQRAYITLEYPGKIVEIDVTKGAKRRTFDVCKFARGIALAPDEKTIYASSYYTGQLVAVDLATGKIADTWDGTSFDNLARHVSLHPTLPWAFVPLIRSKVDRAEGSSSIFPFVSVASLAPAKPDERRRFGVAMDDFNGLTVTCNPWEVAIAPDGKRLYVVYAGTNDMNAAEILGDGYKHLRRVNRLIKVGNNPRAVAVSPDSRTVFVYNTLDFSVSVLEAATMQRVAEISVAKPPYSETVRLGKMLFNSARPPMSQRLWISCSGCHPDGDHDGRTWQNAEGLRRTTHFFGMKYTSPIHWSADRDEVQDFEHTIRGPLMGGSGLIRGKVHESLGAPNAGLSKSLDALAEYCNSLDHRLSPHLDSQGKLTPAAARGKELFFASKTQCATCHSGPDYTDKLVHDVGTGDDDPSEKMGPKFDTPTLLRCYRSTQYLHHGKANSLAEVLTRFNKNDRHGVTSHLTSVEVEELVAFLQALPYETPARSPSVSR